MPNYYRVSTIQAFSVTQHQNVKCQGCLFVLSRYTTIAKSHQDHRTTTTRESIAFMLPRRVLCISAAFCCTQGVQQCRQGVLRPLLSLPMLSKRKQSFLQTAVITTLSNFPKLDALLAITHYVVVTAHGKLFMPWQSY